MISPTEFHEGLKSGIYKTIIKIYQSRQTLDYNGEPMFKIEATITKTHKPIKEDPYDKPYEFKLTIKRNQREINDFITGVKLISLSLMSPKEVDKNTSRLEEIIDNFVEACYMYQNNNYNSRSEYDAYKTIHSFYEYLSLYFDKLRYNYGVYIVRT